MNLGRSWAKMREGTSAASMPALMRPDAASQAGEDAGGSPAIESKLCPTCGGLGTDDAGKECSDCNGTGWQIMGEADPASQPKCSACKGTGQAPDGTPRGCTVCNGTGFTMREAGSATADCPTCSGTGKIKMGHMECPDCHGKGKVPSDSPLLKESDIVRDMRDLREATVLDMNGDGSLRASAVSRLSEKDYSTAKRIELAKSGDAIPIRNDKGDIVGGAYPAEDEDGVDDAIQAYGRNPTPTVKSHIVQMAKKHGTADQQKRAAALGSSDKAKESNDDLAARIEQLERALEGSGGEMRVLQSLREAQPGKIAATFSQPSRVKTSDGQEGYKVVLIREGLGNAADGRWYTKDAIQEMCESGTAEGMQAYADHPDLEEEELRPERSVRHLVGHYKDVKFTEAGGPPRAEAVFVPITLNEEHPTYGWVVALAEAASRNTGPNPLCGISLYGLAAGDYGVRPDGSEGTIATMIRPHSGDIVTNAGAGGGFVRRLMESARAARNHNPKSKEQPMTGEQRNKLQEQATQLREAGNESAAANLESIIAADTATTVPAPTATSSTETAALAEAQATITKLNESLATKDATIEEKDTALREAQGTLGQFTDVMSLTAALREAGVTDDTEMRYFVGQAQSRKLSEAADIKHMVDTERAYEAKKKEDLLEAVREASPIEFDIEGAFGRTPDAADDTGRKKAAVDVLREAGVPIRKAVAA